ncbi:MAG: hypothetical protein AABX17_03380 [Nanoarchaeota archaeon]
MGRLIPQALYSNSRGVLTSGLCDITDYEGIWKRAAERIDIIDPDGRETYSVLRQLQLEAGQIKSR